VLPKSGARTWGRQEQWAQRIIACPEDLPYPKFRGNRQAPGRNAEKKKSRPGRTTLRAGTGLDQSAGKKGKTAYGKRKKKLTPT